MLCTLGEIPRLAAEQFGERIALVASAREFSFRELDRLSDTLAHNLVKLGVAPGDRVTLYGPNSWEWIVSY
jgi:long-chain acyl-CoA synthetase